MRIAKLLFSIALATTLCGNFAFAQGSSFMGLSAGIDLNLVNASIELSNSLAFTTTGDRSQNGKIKLVYGYPIGGSSLGNRGVLSFGGSLGLGDIKSGSSYSVSGLTGSNIKHKNMVSLFIEPGLLFSHSSLVYGKLAYQSMDLEILSTSTSCGVPCVTSTRSDSFRLDGIGYGVGIRTMFDKRTFFQVEALQTTYTGSFQGVEIKPAATYGSVGMGFKF